MRILYSIFLYLITPFVLLQLWWKTRHHGLSRSGLAERLGHYPQLKGCIWMHAVSVGESQATQPIVLWLLKEHPEIKILITTTTATGKERLKQLYANKVSVRYFPLDLPNIIRRVLQRLQPRLMIIMETEIWPNLMYQCHRSDIPVLLINARLSERSVQGYKKIKFLITKTLGHFTGIAVQSQIDLERFLRLGATQSQIRNCGSVKFDISIPASVLEQGDLLRAVLGRQRFIWVAASTHQGEEEIVLTAHHLVLLQYPSALLLLVPRYPERFDEVADLIQRHDFGYSRRSASPSCRIEDQVYLCDSMGELPLFYAAADVAFVGGSLIPDIGGHNLLEPASLGKAIILGPHMASFKSTVDLMQEAGALLQIKTKEELASSLTRLFADSPLRHQMGDAGYQTVKVNQGAIDCIIDFIAPHLK